MLDTHDSELGDLALSRAPIKSENFVWAPDDEGKDGFFWRCPERMGSKQRGRFGVGLNQEYEEEQAEALVAVNSLLLPYRTVANMKISGVVFGDKFNFEVHLNKILNKAKTRMALLTRVSSYSWGLEVGMLRLTGEAPVISLLRYCLAVTG